MTVRTARDDLLEIADLEGEMETEFGIREYTATLRLETYDRPLGPGALITRVDETIVRYPKVVRINDDQASWFAGGARGAGAGTRNGPARFTLSSVAEYTDSNNVARGISLAQLSQAAPGGSYKRFTILLVGPEVANLLHGGDLYMPDSSPYRSTDSLESMIDLARAPIYDPTDGHP